MQTGSLASIFKSYDVRGIYPDELNEDLAYKIGRCFVPLVKGKNVAVGRDMRESGERLFAGFARGASEAGANVLDIGRVSTDALYFAVGKYNLDGGVMITASHNPANYNGLKFTREKAEAISLDTGLSEIRDRIASGNLPPPAAAAAGQITQRNILEDFATHCLSFIDPAKIKPFKIAIDAGNGMAGETVPHIFKHLPCTVVPLYFELDGSTVTALVALNTLKRHPGSKILYNLICSRSVPELIQKNGGIPIRSQVGHSLIKHTMRTEDIIFGGEHSGHFYFRDNWYADSGMIALMECLELFSEANKPVSEVIKPIDTRFRSGEINTAVKDVPGKLRELEAFYKDADIDHLDGVTISYPDWWLNVRPSNTEPLLRLNVEGDTRELMERHRDEALAIIRRS